MKLFATIVIILFFAGGMASSQQERHPAQPCGTSLRLDQFLVPDDASDAKAAFIRFQKALKSGNRARVIDSVQFPIELVLNGTGTVLQSREDLAKRYEEVITGHVRRSVLRQIPEKLIAGWDGVKTADNAVTLTRGEDGDFHVASIAPRHVRQPKEMAEYLKARPDCAPVVVDGRIVAYDSLSPVLPGFEGIYNDHLVVDVEKNVSGELSERRIRVDFWGVHHMPEYNLPKTVYYPGIIWRIYLRPAQSPPSNPEVCNGEVQETVREEDESGRLLGESSTIRILNGEERVTFSGLPSFEARRQYFERTGPLPKEAATTGLTRLVPGQTRR